MQYTALTAAVAVLVCGNMAANAQQGSYSTMSPEGLRTGVIVSEADCAEAQIVWLVLAPGNIAPGCSEWFVWRRNGICPP